MKKFLLALLCIVSNVYSAEDSVYDFKWLDKDKEIYVLQNRTFRKDGKFSLSLGGGSTLNNAFVNSYVGQARAGYFFTEKWGIDFIYSMSSNQKSDTEKGVREQGTIPFTKQIQNYYGALITWAPFYGKFNTFDEIVYVDWTFGAGLASINTKDNRNEFALVTDKSLSAESNMGLIWTTGLRFYLSERWAFRLDMTGLNYKATKSGKLGALGSRYDKKEWFNTYDFTAGINFTF